MNTAIVDLPRPDSFPEWSAQAPAWQLALARPVARQGVCALAQPCLRRAQPTPDFHFQTASLLLVASGVLTLGASDHDLVIDNDQTLVLVEPDTWANLQKTPGGLQPCFRSVFLTFSPGLVEQYHRDRPVQRSAVPDAVRLTSLDAELATTLRWVCASVPDTLISDERLRYRLLDLLAALDERGVGYGRPRPAATATRLRRLISDSPEHPWTAREAGHALAMSEATLRRRLAADQVRFDAVLVEVRMHHGLMLLQTTDWPIEQVAQACGYRSRARFASRFQQRFGYLPSTVR